jgi:DNA-directed RNA polymerase
LDKDLILSAESPFIFTSFCLNMREIHNNPNAIIKTPIFLDATCSGIQHLAGLMKDIELGSNTNLIPSTIEDKPGDIYTLLLETINKAINK